MRRAVARTCAIVLVLLSRVCMCAGVCVCVCANEHTRVADLQGSVYKAQFVFHRQDVVHIDVFGLVVIDARDATVAVLKGKAIIPLNKAHSQVPGKFKAGGQSAMRFQQNRELAVKAHYKKVADLFS